MIDGYPLLPLDCPDCGAGIAADGQDVVFYCTACRNGYRFDPEGSTLVPIEVSFVALPSREVDFHLPFWVLPAQISVLRREAKGGSFDGLLRFFFGSNDASTGVAEGTFAVPAFQASLLATTMLTRRYTEALPGLGERLGEKLIGGSYGVEDARKLAHYALLASEIEKPDTLTDFEYQVEFGTEALLGVPFVRVDRGVQDAVFGIAL